MRATARAQVPAAEAGAWTEPWHGLVAEVATGPGTFACAEGPFRSYERRVETTAPDADGLVRVTSTVDFRLAVPYFGALLALPVRAALRRPGAALPWWGPAARLDARATTVLAALCAAAMVTGFLGTTITQTLTYVADGFGVTGTGPQSVVLTVVRSSILVSLLLATLADRHGRRRLLIGAASAGCVLSLVCALTPTLVVFTAVQVLLRGCSAATALLVTVVAAEEVPAGARAFAVSVVGMSAALGAGICVLALPLADIGDNGWRLIYVLPVAALPLLVSVARRLPESRRFTQPHAQVGLAGHGARLGLLATSTFVVQLFLAPASQLQNEFLRDERGYSAVGITLFTLLTNTPAGLGILAGGRLADVHGRRGVAAVGLLGGAGFTVAMYLSSGAPMWAWSLVAGIVAAVTVPALGVYGPELFPTGVRSGANGLLALSGVAGSATGILAAGALSDSLGGLGHALAVLSVGPIVLAALVLTRYPETAGLELEQLNPEDEARPATR